MKRPWLVVRYTAGSGPYIVCRHWRESRAERCLKRWREWNEAGELPHRALIEYQLSRRSR